MFSDWNAWEEPSTSFRSSQENKDEVTSNFWVTPAAMNDALLPRLQERLLREEKRRQRRAEMEAKKANRKGPMKLGAKKMAVD